jgi:polysaccharide biosynthesis/export protein
MRQKWPQCREFDQYAKKTQFANKVLSGLGIVLLAFVSGCANPGIGLDPAAAQIAPALLQAGDVVKILFPQAPELNQSQKLRVDGIITLPHIGDVKAAGKSPGELQADLERLFKPHLASAQVLVIVESSIMAIYVSGAVNRPGKVLFDRPMTVLEAVMEAGGPTQMADTRRVRLIRQGRGKYETKYVNLSPTLGGRTTDVQYVQPGDVIFVRERAFNF